MPTTSKVQVTPIHILHHHRLYERYMFFYAVIMSVWLIIASYVFTHYKIDALTIQQNLALGFLYYLFFAVMIGLTPFWFRITLYRFTETDTYHQSILETLEKSATQQEYDEMADFLAQNGELAPTFKQTLALMTIFWLLIFELYFLYAWIDPKTAALLWKFDWMQSAIQWVINHTNPEGKGIKSLISFTFDPPSIRRSETWRATTLGMLQTPSGNTLVLVHLWFMFSYAIILFCMCKVLWRAVDWLGFERVNPKNIYFKSDFIWCSLASLPFSVFFITGIFSFLILNWFSALKLASVIDVTMWFTHLRLYLLVPVFFLFFIKWFLGWCQFWKRIISNKFGKAAE